MYMHVHVRVPYCTYIAKSVEHYIVMWTIVRIVLMCLVNGLHVYTYTYVRRYVHTYVSVY